MTVDHVETNEVVEHFIRSMVKEAGADPRAIMVGVHNAFAHGDILVEANYDVGDNSVHLEEFYRGIDIAQVALNAMLPKSDPEAYV